MILYPAVDLMGGRVVQLVGGKPGTEQVNLPDPFAVVDRWVGEGADWLHIVDLDAALGLGDNRLLVERLIERAGVACQVGGGVRTTQRVRDLFEAGARRVVVGTQALKDPGWLQQIAYEFPDRIVLAVDARDGIVVSHGWTAGTGKSVAEVAKAADRLQLAALLYTAVHVEGRLQGIDRAAVQNLVRAVKLPVIASGGVSSLDDVRVLRDAGCAGAVVGLALYLDRFSFPQAKALAEVPKV